MCVCVFLYAKKYKKNPSFLLPICPADGYYALANWSLRNDDGMEMIPCQTPSGTDCVDFLSHQLNHAAYYLQFTIILETDPLLRQSLRLADTAKH